jgi:4a-hydroxytetrahydrobiopterin dehydratase
MSERIGPHEFLSADGVGGDWRVLGEGACAFFRAGALLTAAQFVQAVAALADDLGEAPDVDLRGDGITVRLVDVTPDHVGLVTTHVELARQISALARELDLPSDPTALQAVHLTVDALVAADVMPFWSAVLGYDVRGDSPEDLLDPRGRGPGVWFQDMDGPRPQRNRMHVDVWVGHDQGQARVAAALAAGGHLVDDGHAPSWWVLADAEGNEVCVATIVGRG